MLKKVSIFFILLVFGLSLSGCATTRRDKDLEMQGLRNQISVLESQVQARDEEIDSLKSSLSGNRGEGFQKTTPISELKSRPNNKQIQAALQNAGFAPGPIDGKIGRQTRDAIRAFQRANDLAVDGKVGKQTWDSLKEYLNKKVK